MKKPYTYTELSERVCVVPGCTKRIKLNVLDRTPRARKCYAHYCAETKRDSAARKNNRRDGTRRIDQGEKNRST